MPSGTQIGTLKPVVFLQANWFVMFCVMYFCYIFYRKPPSYFKCSGFWFLICPLNYFIWICVVYIITLWASIVQVWVSSQTYSCNILREIGMLNLKKNSFLSFFWGGGEVYSLNMLWCLLWTFYCCLFQKHDQLVISHLLVPTQSGTADSCTTQKEEDIFDYQDQHDLITIGWIHVIKIT